MKRNVTDLMRIKLNSLFFLLALSATSLSAAPKQVALQYKIIFLGTFGGNQTIATAINDLDDVAGYSQLTDPTNTTGAQNAFWNKNNKLVDLDPKDTYSGLGESITTIKSSATLLAHKLMLFCFETVLLRILAVLAVLQA
jgi:hypothetical protein